MTHDELRELAAAYALDTVTAAERVAFEAHLTECVECRSEVASFRPVVQGLALTAPLQAPPRGLRGRVLGAASERPVEPRITRPVRVWGWGTAAALAALIVAAIGLGGHIANLRGRMAALEAELRKTALAAARDRQSLEDLRRAVDEADAARLVLGATDLARIDLKAEAAAAGARARAFWNRSSGLVFTASALPTVPDGKVYQLWVLTAGDPVSAGLLRPDPGGSVDLFVKTPLDLPAPVGMAVTVEPSGGVPQPTGERILLGLE